MGEEEWEWKSGVFGGSNLTCETGTWTCVIALIAS